MGVANQLDAAVYQRAERLLRHNRSTLVIGGTVVPRWADGGARFWYVQTTTAGSHFVLVDPRAGRRGPVFDHDRLAAALSSASGHEVSPRALPFGAIDLTTDAVEFGAFCTRWRCRLDSYECAKVQTRPTPAPEGVVSPDGQLAVFRRGYDLWARSLVEGREWALTTDGHEDYDYGTEPDPATKLGMPSMPAAVAWSPDSTRVLVTRTDQRGVRRVHLVDSYPTEGGAPRLLTKRYPYPGDAHVAFSEFLVLDVAAGTSVRAKADPVPTPYFSPIVIGEAWWSADGSTVFYLSHSQDFRTLHLCRFDPVTGEVSTVVTEVGETRVDANQFNQGIPPIVTSLSSGEEVLWYSQRDGWGHLYRYDARSGELLGQVTSGHWAVREILHVDEQHRVVYFLACGLVAANPYRRLVCRVRLDGTEFAVVTDDGLDHVATVSANGDYFLDCASTTDTPPVVTARDWNGRVLVEVDRADITRLVAAGWTPPRPFRTTAADGHTDLYGLLYLPPYFDPTKSYPVIDHPYPGPQTYRVGAEFNDQDGLFSCPAEAMAALGFVVMAVDGRGTPGRSKAFHDASYQRLFEAGSMVDHIATLR
ncbi:MAG: DPP IV N-terminal domain-containing protein, partial [Kutzneria sp.]|nr:DPP IV N-terminal domain-containing protein [Kutzneria sp.]